MKIYELDLQARKGFWNASLTICTMVLNGTFMWYGLPCCRLPFKTGTMEVFGVFFIYCFRLILIISHISNAVHKHVINAFRRVDSILSLIDERGFRIGSRFSMTTQSNGNIFRVTGPLCGEFTSPGELPTQRPVTQSFDVFFDLRLNKRLSKQSWGWWFETLSRPLWRHLNAMQ